MWEAIVLAGGKGTRLQSVVTDVPKPMAPVGGKPFLEMVLTTLAAQGFGRVVLSVGYMPEKIVQHFGVGFKGMELVYEIENQPLGTGGATRAALQRCLADHAFVFNGDTYLEVEAAQANAVWLAQQSPVIIAKRVDDTSRYGSLLVQNDKVVAFMEKGRTGPGLINAGSYILPKTCLDHFPPNKPFSIETDFFAHAVKQQPLALFETRGHFLDIGIPEDYAKAQLELPARIKP